MLQVGPAKVVFNESLADWLSLLGPTAPSLILPDVTESAASLSELTEPFASLGVVTACCLRSLVAIVPSLMSAPVISFAPAAPPPTPTTRATTARNIVGALSRVSCIVGPPSRGCPRHPVGRALVP